MKPNRQKLLIAGFAVVVLVVIGDRLGWQSMLNAPLDAREQKRLRLEKEVQKREAALAKTRAAAKEMTVWQRQSLPSDPQVARSLYQAWLLELVGRVGLSNHSVDAGQPRNLGGQAFPITFNVQGRGSLQQLTQFLHEFYRAGHLHQIHSLVMRPVGKKDTLDLAITIETLVLASADRKDKLSSEKSERLARPSFADYAVVAERNLFSTTGPIDPTDYTVLTGINFINGEPVAWFSQQTETEPGKGLMKLRTGTTFQIGQFHGTVLRIDEQDVVLEADGELWLVTVGETLAQASALPPEF